jgi:CBS domain-containing protein
VASASRHFIRLKHCCKLSKLEHTRRLENQQRGAYLKGMSTFTTAVAEYTSSPVITLNETDSVLAAREKLAMLRISALAVVDRDGGLVGVISRSDLLRIGRRRASQTTEKRRQVLALPNVPVRQVMTQSVEIIAASTTLAEAAKRMTRQRVHRLYISSDRRPEGVLSTKDLMQAVVDARVSLPVSELMNPNVVSVRASDALSVAIDRMASAEQQGLVVVEDDYPVGVFTQEDALAAREAPPDLPIDQFMQPRVICVPVALPVFRAAEQAIAAHTRRVLAVDGTAVRGVVSGMDFARLVAHS